MPEVGEPAQPEMDPHDSAVDDFVDDMNIDVIAS